MRHTQHYMMAFLCFVLSLTIWADSGELYTSGKLSSSLINCITQDKQGFIWVGTEYGLNKFDGYHFTNFLHNAQDTTSITDNIISSFLVDKQGRFWIGSAKGMMRYDYANNNFKRYPFPDGRQPRIYSLIEDHQGNILIGTAGYGLYSIRQGKDQITSERQYAQKDSDVFFTHIYEDHHHYLWQSSHLSEFTRYFNQNGNIYRKNFQSPYGAPVAFIQHNPTSMLIVCMYGILYYNYKTELIADAGYNLGPFKDNVTINNATFDHEGNLYISTSEHGVLIIKKDSNKVEQLESSSNNFQLASAFVNDVMEDKDNNLWVGCYKKGLYLLNQRKSAFNFWSFSSQNYVIGSSVSSIASGNHGETWCTVQNSGVFCFDKQGKIIAHPHSPAGTSIIYKDLQGNYWIGTGNALYSYNPYTGNYQQKLNFASAGVYCIADDSQGNLYISVYSKGIYVYNKESGSVKVFNMQQRKNPRGYLCNDWVRTMTIDSKGMLWIGTSNGVSCMNTQQNSFNDYGWHNLLKDHLINSICEGDHGDIFIGTDEGLYYYNRQQNKVMDFPGADALKGKLICGIVKDRHGDLWISSTMGIWQYSKASKSFLGHINGNGLKSQEYMLGAMMHQSDDLIGFGSADGITTFYPEVVKSSKIKLGKVHLTNFIIDGKSINSLTDRFVIPYSQNSFTLEFSLLNYKNTDKICFQYRINEGNWNSTNEGANAISFNKLTPGKYTLEVRAANHGQYSQQSTLIHITVKDPWFASTWAYLAYFIVAMGLIAYFIYTYERKRKADLDETKMKFLINATHDIRSPLTLIMGPLNKLKSRITDEESKQDLQTIDRNAQRLLLLVNQILDERKIDKNQMQLHCQETNLLEFTKGIISLFAFTAKERNIELKLTTDDSMEAGLPLNVWIDRINFDKVISNLLSNAMKYTFDGGSIILQIGKDNQNAIIKVMDTGIGFKEEEKTDKLFERFYQGKNTRDLHIVGTGIGLNLSRAIVNMHGGTIKAYNRTDVKGACLEVQIPLGKAHLKPEEILAEKETSNQDTQHKKKQASRNFKLLVVDDDTEIAQYIQNELGEWYRFDHAANGKEALKQLLTNNYDLVISDVMMPEMDGITLLKKIKGNSNISDIPVILLTSKSEVENRLEGLKKGADAFLAKPFNMEELHILIDNLVDNVRRIRGKYTQAQGQAAKIDKIEVVGNNDALMDRVMKCINDNLSNPDFKVEKLTEEVGISRAQLHRKMKEITGVSTAEFIRNMRLEQAANLIKEGKINVTQVAFSVGFNNQTHFSTVFKKHFGVSPSEYAATKNK